MAPFFSGAHLILVPLRVGSGSRLKILESFAYGRPVVSTTIGAEGLDTENAHQLVEQRHGWSMIDDIMTGVWTRAVTKGNLL
jgi:hypothetical protein